MSHPINKKAVYTARYPKGTIIELVEPLEDPYAPKHVGSRFKMDCVTTKVGQYSSCYKKG